MVRPRRHDGPPPGGFRNGGPPPFDAPYHSYGRGGGGGGYREPPRPFDSYDSYRPGSPRFNDDRYHARPPPPRDFRSGPPRYYSDDRRPPPPRDFGGPRDGGAAQGIPPWELRQRRDGPRPPPGRPALFASRAPPPAAPSGSHRGVPPPRAPRSPDPPVILPSDTYVELSGEGDVLGAEVVPKLLVLDLNGALVYRAGGTGKHRRAYPRPFLHNFLEYLFGPDADGRAWEVFVWSSAQPHNVRSMVETTFGAVYSRGVWDQPAKKKKNKNPEDIELESPGKSQEDGKSQEEEQGHLLGVWGRDKMALGDNYFKKVQTQKDLRKVIEHLGKYDEKRVVLLDDSPLKGVYQPWSQIVITEYDKPEFKDSKDAIMRLAERAKGLKISSSSPAKSPAAAEGAVESSEEKDELDPDEDEISGPNTDMTHEPGLDTTLLAVIGILEAMRCVRNVPAWIRGGGILKPTAELVVEGDVSESTLPSHATFTHWFADPKTLAYWTQRGREALLRRDIALDHGMRFSPSGEFFPLADAGGASPAPSPAPTPVTAEEGKGKVLKGKLLHGKKADAAYRHLQAVGEIELVNEHQRSAVHAALQVLRDIGMAPFEEMAAPRLSFSPEPPSPAQDAVSATSEPSEAKKRPRYLSPSKPVEEMAVPSDEEVI